MRFAVDNGLLMGESAKVRFKKYQARLAGAKNDYQYAADA